MGNDSILVVVDRLSKAAHFIPLKHPYSAPEVAQAYFDNVYKLHGMPEHIVSDRDPIFISNFWQELFAVQGVELDHSSAYHPQSDGQTEVLNRCLETYLRCFCSEVPNDWCKWVPAAEFWYNTSYHQSLKCSPYEVLYGQPPPIHLPYLPGESKVEAVDRTLLAREEALKGIRLNLARAQNRMKQLADKDRSEREFEEGDYVYLKLQPYRQTTVGGRGNQKLSKRYYGPYKVLKRIGPVAYRLALPHSAKIHPTFHVSLLKKCHGPSPTTSPLPTPSVAIRRPELIMARKTVKRGRISATKVLVKWTDSEIEDATWEFLYDLQANYPDFNPWGQGSVQEEGIDASEGAPVSADTLVLGANEGITKKKTQLEGNRRNVNQQMTTTLIMVGEGTHSPRTPHTLTYADR
ncbi:hypothetical protein RND81_12G133200 [Saponaria officinalis]|uniref:Integrase catalytic domain-containing protein n=1 Tax=Saponaria officinalis TaxID=3572 RepID=A0AAW1HA78_SAPOF